MPGKATGETKKEYFILYIALYTYKMINDLYTQKIGSSKLNYKDRATEKYIGASKIQRLLALGK